MRKQTFLRHAIVFAAFAWAVASCGGATSTVAPSSTPTLAPAIDLPPAWTVTPTATPIPETATPSPTLHPAVLSARQTASPWPTLGIVAVGAGADTTDWQQLELPGGSILLPAGYRQIDQRRYDPATTSFMEDLAASMVQAAAGEGTPTPTPAPLDELRAAHGFDFWAAEDAAEQLDVYVVSGPLPAAFDLDSILIEAARLLVGEKEVSARETVGGAPLPTGRVFVRLFDRTRGTVEDRVIYVVLGDERAWIITFRSEDFDQFTALRPAFETSGLSLSPSP